MRKNNLNGHLRPIALRLAIPKPGSVRTMSAATAAAATIAAQLQRLDLFKQKKGYATSKLHSIPARATKYNNREKEELHHGIYVFYFSPFVAVHLQM